MKNRFLEAVQRRIIREREQVMATPTAVAAPATHASAREMPRNARPWRDYCALAAATSRRPRVSESVVDRVRAAMARRVTP